MGQGCKRGARQSRQVWGCMAVGESRVDGVLGGGMLASGRDRKVLETNRLVVGLCRQVSERNMWVVEMYRKVWELHTMALNFCWFRKQ